MQSACLRPVAVSLQERYGDVVLRIQGVVALFARLDDDVRFGFAMPDYV